ncbi:MAG: LytTR family DNA-binding domain-containing protein [Lewinella sp.]
MKLSNNPLRRPFPDREFGPETIVGMLWVSLFVFCALFFLRPLGMHVPGNAFLTCIGYALVTFIVAACYAFVTSRIFNWEKSGDNWTLGKWILDSGLLLACISVGNFVFYNFTVNWTAFSPIVLATITVPTVLIGLFPIAFSGMAVQIRAERDHQRTAGQLQLATARSGATTSDHRLIELGDGGFSVDPGTILFCESRQNYVRCGFLDQGNFREETIRATLSGIEEKLADRGILRCHRSYLVNPRHIRSARGNAQGLRLDMIGMSEEVPVSRAYVKVLREVLL